MKTVFKYPIQLCESQQVALPVKAQILSVQIQNGVICLWAYVETENQSEPREIHIYATGEPLSEVKILDYIGTIQQGGFVWHVFIVS